MSDRSRTSRSCSSRSGLHFLSPGVLPPMLVATPLWISAQVTSVWTMRKLVALDLRTLARLCVVAFPVHNAAAAFILSQQLSANARFDLEPTTICLAAKGTAKQIPRQMKGPYDGQQAGSHRPVPSRIASIGCRSHHRPILAPQMCNANFFCQPHRF
jgi:hypothetical protein